MYQTIGNYLRNLQKFSNVGYDVYVRSYELPNSSHFPPQTLIWYLDFSLCTPEEVLIID